jgi:hypothetical protein
MARKLRDAGIYLGALCVTSFVKIRVIRAWKTDWQSAPTTSLQIHRKNEMRRRTRIR